MVPRKTLRRCPLLPQSGAGDQLLIPGSWRQYCRSWQGCPPFLTAKPECTPEVWSEQEPVRANGISAGEGSVDAVQQAATDAEMWPEDWGSSPLTPAEVGSKERSYDPLSGRYPGASAWECQAPSAAPLSALALWFGEQSRCGLAHGVPLRCSGTWMPLPVSPCTSAGRHLCRDNLH